jgi:hypothetical protein
MSRTRLRLCSLKCRPSFQDHRMVCVDCSALSTCYAFAGQNGQLHGSMLLPHTLFYGIVDDNDRSPFTQ